MCVRTKVDGHAVCKEGDIGTMIGIDTAQKILIGLAGPARMLNGDETGN